MNSLLLSILLLPTLAHPRAEDTSAIGLIESFKGHVKLRSARDGKESALRDKLDFGKVLYGKDQLSLEEGSTLTYIIGTRRNVLNGPKSGYPIPQARKGDNSLTNAMRFYARIGGRKRGGDKQIYDPASDAAIWPDDFAIRWTPDAAVKQGTARLLVGTETLWSGDVDAAKGMFNDQLLIDAVRDAQKEDMVTAMIVSIEFGDGTRQESNFNLVSKKTEAKVKTDIAASELAPDSLAFGLGKAHILHEAGLLNAVADEFEELRHLAPQSVDLIKADIVAQLEVGNVRRADDLRKLLREEDRPKDNS